MKRVLGIGALGAACASCLVVPALLAAGGAGLASGALGFSLAGLEVALALGLCAVLVATLAFAMSRRRAVSNPAATGSASNTCAADGSCGCGPVQGSR